MSIGLKRGTVAVEPHNEEWCFAAQEMINKLKSILKGDIVDVQHIGSTAIKNICAKPIIDLVVGVECFEKIMVHNEALKRNGIVYRRQEHPGQHLYVCVDTDNNIQTHFIHVVIYGENQWNDYLNMRDYLNAHKDKAKEYSDLKEKLAKKFAKDRTEYTNGKGEFISKILQEAQQWRKGL